MKIKLIAIGLVLASVNVLALDSNGGLTTPSPVQESVTAKSVRR